LAGIQNGAEDLKPKPTETLVENAKRLLARREELAAEEERLTSQRMTMARESMRRPEPEVVVVPSAEWQSWFEEGKDGR
jgi:hypothetical protein